MLVVSRLLYALASERVLSETGIPGERLLLAATHSHQASPGILPDDEQRFLAARIAEAVALARQVARPAVLSVSRGHLTLPSYNRAGGDLYTPEGESEPKSRTDVARLDPDLSVLAFADAGTREPIAVLVNYAVHPVVLFGELPLVSTDFVTQLERRVQAAASTARGTPLAMWMIGAAGDVNPVYHDRSYRHAEWTGTKIADEVALLMQDDEPERLTHASLAQKVIPLPEPGSTTSPPNAGDIRSPRAVGGPTSARVQAIRLATPGIEVGVVSWPGEPHARVGVDLKRALRAGGLDDAVVLSLANEWGGYFRTAREHDDGYRGSPLMFYGRETSAYISTQLLDLMSFLTSGDPIEAVTLPPHAAAERAALAAAAQQAALADESRVRPLAARPDPEAQVLSPPADVTRPGVVSVTWQGGSTDVDEDWIPEVHVERRVGGLFAGVAREGTGEVLLSLERGTNRWTAQWQTLPDTPTGEYRVVMSGRRQDITGPKSYTLTSQPFVVSACTCLVASDLITAASADGTSLSVAVSYPEATANEFRMLPGAVTPSQRTVTTGEVVVEVRRGNEIVDLVSLTFASSISEEPDAEAIQMFPMPTEQGVFAGTWTGQAGDVSFHVRGVDDGYGNSASTRR